MNLVTKSFGFWRNLEGEKYYTFLFSLMVLSTASSHASAGETVTLADDGCSMYDSCNVSDFFRTCSCDEDCNLYGTCCFDAPSYDNMNSGTGFVCSGDRLTQPVFFRKHCHEDFSGDTEVKRSCEEESPNVSDMMRNTPVTSSKTKVTYWNWNCAICNNEEVSDLSFWTVQASCPVGKSSKRFDVDVYRKNIAYDKGTDSWGIYEDYKFKTCPMSVYQPPFLTGRLRYCAPNMVSDCPSSWNDEEVLNKCKVLHGERKRKDSTVYYKNVYCAICNKIPMTQLECFGRNYKTYPPVSDMNTMKIIFNMNPSKGGFSLDSLLCSNEKRYDPFRRKCRSINCGMVEDIERDVCQNLSSPSSALLPSLITAILTFTASSVIGFHVL